MSELIIDDQKCLNSRQCAYLQPELLELEPIVTKGSPKGNLMPKANDAIEMCPTQAISLVDD